MIPHRPIIAAILFLASLAVVFFLAWPGYQKFQQTSQELRNARKELDYVNEYYANLEKLRDQLAQYQPLLLNLDAALPPKASLPALFNYLQIVSSQNGLVLGQIGKPVIGPSKLKPDIKEIKLELSLIGSYSSLKNLLESFYRNTRLIEVDSISFSTPKEEELFDFKVVIRTHSY